ncbi:MAG: hypothetical protein KF694_05115 [Mesorhizobium sp.]|nr:hypothetical protein [Mesorhizobium sp.]
MKNILSFARVPCAGGGQTTEEWEIATDINRMRKRGKRKGRTAVACSEAAPFACSTADVPATRRWESQMPQIRERQAAAPLIGNSGKDPISSSLNIEYIMVLLLVVECLRSVREIHVAEDEMNQEAAPSLTLPPSVPSV